MLQLLLLQLWLILLLADVRAVLGTQRYNLDWQEHSSWMFSILLFWKQQRIVWWSLLRPNGTVAVEMSLFSSEGRRMAVGISEVNNKSYCGKSVGLWSEAVWRPCQLSSFIHDEKLPPGFPKPPRCSDTYDHRLWSFSVVNKCTLPPSMKKLVEMRQSLSTWSQRNDHIATLNVLHVFMSYISCFNLKLITFLGIFSLYFSLAWKHSGKSWSVKTGEYISC